MFQGADGKRSLSSSVLFILNKGLFINYLHPLVTHYYTFRLARTPTLVHVEDEIRTVAELLLDCYSARDELEAVLVRSSRTTSQIKSKSSGMLHHDTIFYILQGDCLLHMPRNQLRPTTNFYIYSRGTLIATPGEPQYSSHTA
jgi:hypothetical protein